MRFLDYFDNFLKNKRVYKENQAFWRLAIANWCDEENDEFTSIADRDGNPLLHVVFPKVKKSFKVIQHKKGSEPVAFSAWVKNADASNIPSAELVIALQLNTETYRDAEKLFKTFFFDFFSIEEKINTINQKYKIEW